MGMFDSFTGQGDGYTRGQRTGLRRSAEIKRGREEKEYAAEQKLKTMEGEQALAERRLMETGATGRMGMRQTGETGRMGMRQAGETGRRRLADIAESQRQQAGFRDTRMSPTYKTGQTQYSLAQYATKARSISAPYTSFTINPETGETMTTTPDWAKRLTSKYEGLAMLDPGGAAEKLKTEFEASKSYMDKWLTKENKDLIAEKSGLSPEALADLGEKTPETARATERLIGEIRAKEEERLYGEDSTLTSEGIPIVEGEPAGRLAEIQAGIEARKRAEREGRVSSFWRGLGEGL
jgi:hypothetical protein